MNTSVIGGYIEMSYNKHVYSEFRYTFMKNEASLLLYGECNTFWHDNQNGKLEEFCAEFVMRIVYNWAAK